EENVGAKRFEKWPLVAAAKEQGFVQTHAPAAQREDHPLVRRRRTRGDERGADRRVVTGGKRRLQTMQRREESAEWPAGQRFVGKFGFVAMKGIDALLLRDALGFVAEDHRVAVEGDAQLIRCRRRRLGRQYRRRGNAGNERGSDA